MALRNMSVPAFKAAVGAAKFDFLVNPHTKKTFVSADTGKNYKVEQAIDYKKPIVVLFDDELDLDSSACFINERESVKPVHTL